MTSPATPDERIREILAEELERNGYGRDAAYVRDEQMAVIPSTMALAALRRLVPSPAGMEGWGATMQNFHDAWGYAKDHTTEHSDGYRKEAFGYVQFWLDKLRQQSSPPTASPSASGGLRPEEGESAWLAEVPPNHGFKPVYYAGGSRKDMDFTTDANKAIRFSRQQDAAVVIKALNILGAEPREHAWPALSSISGKDTAK